MPKYDPSEVFKRVELKPPRGAIVRIIGPEGSGKDSLAFSAPGPIGVISFSENTLTGVWREFTRDGGNPNKRIDIAHAGDLLRNVTVKETIEARGADKEHIKAKADVALEKFGDLWIYALENYRTVVLDTDEALTELVHYWYFGNTKGEVNPSEYAVPNRVYKTLINFARDLPGKHPDRNVIFLGKMREKWGIVPSTGKLGKLGKLEPVGKDIMKFFPEAVLELGVDEEQAKINAAILEGLDRKGSFVSPFYAKVRKGYLNAKEMLHRRIQGDNLTWGRVMAMLTRPMAELMEEEDLAKAAELWDEELPPIEEGES